MSGARKDDKKNSGWNDWQHKQNDWNISNTKRPKLDIQKSHLSQSTAVKAGKSTVTECQKVKTFRKTNSMPSSNSSPSKEDDSKFFDIVQDELDAIEAKVLAEAADAVEHQMATEKVSPINSEPKAIPSSSSNVPQSKPISSSKSIPSVQSKPISSDAHLRNNGSSGFEVLFEEELAQEDIEECMMLASQEIQATEKRSFADISAYNIFAKEINAHSSIMESNFKKPPLRAPTINNLQKTNQAATGPKPSSKLLPSASSSSAMTISKPQSIDRRADNPQAEAEVRRLSLDMERLQSENKKLKESLRTKEGEVSILRSQLRKAVNDAIHQKTVNDHSVIASKQQYGKKLREMEKEIENLQITLKFMEAELKEAKQRLTLLSQASPQVKLVQPSTSSSVVPPCSTPQRGSNKQKHVSSFLNRSTFEDRVEPSQERSRKRLRLADDHDKDGGKLPLEINRTVPDIDNLCEKPESKSSESQTLLTKDELDDVTWIHSSDLSVGERLSERLSGLQLISDVRLEQELIGDRNIDLDDMETIPTLSLLSLKPNAKKRRCVLDEKQRPSLLNCSKSLQSLLRCNDTTTLSAAGKASLLQVYQECCGIIHYHLFLLQDMEDSLSDKQLKKRDQQILMNGSETLPLHKRYDLLDDKPWHKDEFGVEVRRSLGIMCELATAYRFGALLVTGQCEVNIPRHKFCELPDFIQDCSVHDVSPQDLSEKEQFWFLKVLCDMASVIVRQKGTIALSGVLAGMVVLLKTCAQQKAVLEESQTIVLSIIRGILLARPPSTVLLFVLELLVYCFSCEEIMKGLCVSCDDEDCIQNTSDGTCTFSKDTCALQLLCIQLKTVCELHCWRLVDVLVRWLLLVISLGWGAPSWILSSSGSSHVQCCSMLFSAVVSLLWDTFERYCVVEAGDCMGSKLSLPENVPTEKDKSLLSSFPRIMRRAIALFHGLLVNKMCDYMAHVEGSYELLLRKLSQMNNLNLTPALQRELSQLLQVEQVTTKPDSLIDNEEDLQGAKFYWDSAVALLKLSP